MMRHLRLLTSIGLCLSISLLVACHQESKQKNAPATSSHTFTIATQTNQNALYFTGIIQPIQIVNVPSPVNGTISKLYFRYGQRIAKGAPLVLIHSPKLQDDYQKALTAFLKAKNDYNNLQVKWQGTQDLYKEGLIAKNEYDTEKSTLSVNYLSLKQAQQALNAILQNTQGRTLNIDQLEKLDLEQLSAVEKALSAKLDSLPIKAPTYGVVLMPNKNSDAGAGNDSGDNKQIKLGSEVKENQPIVRIGDFTGIRLNVEVNEIDIGNIKLGQKVLITGVAFPGITLTGHVKNIDTQAISSQNGGLPVFPIEITVDKLSKIERQRIHLGMSAKASLIIEQPQSISIPIKAVKKVNGKAQVQLVNKNGHPTKTVTIQTGKTTADRVLVAKGLHPGDTILVAH